MLYQESRRIGRKSAVGFIGLAIIIVAQMLFSGWVLSRMYQEMRGTLINTSDLQLEALELKSLLGDIRRFEKDLLFASEEAPDEMAAAKRRWSMAIKDAIVQIDVLHDEAIASSNLVHVSPERLKESLGKYAQGVERVLAQLVSTPIGVHEANHNLAPAKAIIYQTAEWLDQIVEEAENYEQVAIANLAEQRLWFFASLALTALLSLLLCAVLSIHIARSSQSISRQLEHQALHDTLTGLLNRRGLTLLLNEGNARGGVLAYIDLDRFKLINDLCGHTAGDDLLVELTAKMAAYCEQHRGTLARVGGDEFTVWLPGEPDLERARILSEEIVNLIENHSFSWLDQPLTLGASIGLAPALPGFVNRELLARADAACRLAKQPGSAKVLVYEEADPALQKARHEERWAARLPQLIQDGRFCLYAQRVLPLQPQHGQGHGHAEILLRGIDSQGQIVPPGNFLPAAERFGLMPRLDRWVIETLLASPLVPGYEYAVNISGQTLMDKEYLPELEALLRQSGKAHQISFEITESAAMQGIETAREYIRRLRALGCRFALDDFGSGFSSFAYLRDLQVDFLKIDGSLVRILGREAADAALLRAIVQMAQTLSLQTIAEFVETPAIADQLTAMGVDFGQGFGLHRPEPLADLNARLAGQQKVSATPA